MIIYNQLYNMSQRSLMHPSKNKENEIKKPLLVFSFDDGYMSDFDIAYPEMKARGIKGTSFIVPTWVGQEGYMNWSEIHTLNNDSDWDIQCHTYTHPRLADLTEQEIHEQMQMVDQAFLSNGLESPKHHAYPFGSTSAVVRSVLSEYRLTQRATGLDERHLNDYRTIKPDEFKGISVDAQNSERLEMAKRVITRGVNERKIIYLYNHRIVPEIGDYPYQTLESNFIEILDHISNTGIETVTISELYERLF